MAEYRVLKVGVRNLNNAFLRDGNDGCQEEFNETNNIVIAMNIDLYSRIARMIGDDW
jgi:hypothetical protein